MPPVAELWADPAQLARRVLAAHGRGRGAGALGPLRSSIEFRYSTEASPALVASLFHAAEAPPPPNVLVGAVARLLYFTKRYTNSGARPHTYASEASCSIRAGSVTGDTWASATAGARTPIQIKPSTTPTASAAPPRRRDSETFMAPLLASTGGELSERTRRLAAGTTARTEPRSRRPKLDGGLSMATTRSDRRASRQTSLTGRSSSNATPRSRRATSLTFRRTNPVRRFGSRQPYEPVRISRRPPS